MYNNTKYPFNVDIESPFGQLGPVIEWCTTHCSDYWNFDVGDQGRGNNGLYKFSFKSEKDYITFMVFQR